MHITLALLATAVVSAKAHADRHAHNWDYNGGYPHGGWRGQRHMPSTNPFNDVYDNATFPQLIDHGNSSLGNFSQFYYYDTTYWKGPGSPIILFTPGEVNASFYTDYLDNSKLTGVLAEKIGAATIVLEHRYWGASTPFTNLTTANLQYLTLKNALKDMTHFAQTVQLPFVKGAPSNAEDVPWVTMGGSYSGSISAYLASVEPGTFWAYHASSAPVQAISNYWEYFEPVQQGMAKNCSKDVARVINHMDAILLNGTAQDIHRLKAQFKMQSVTHNDDFMAALESAAWLWQGNQFFTDFGYYAWCDCIENATVAANAASGNATALPGPDGVGLPLALQGYATWWTDWQLPNYCAHYGYAAYAGVYNTACFDSYNASSPLFADTALSNAADRQWIWMTCNEPFAYFQGGAPRGHPSLVSRLVTEKYWARQCGVHFPPGPKGETFGLAKGRTAAELNAWTGGWDITNTTRLIYVNGDLDPWREASVSADQRPGGPLRSTKQVPVEIVPGGYHTSDMIMQNGVHHPEVAAVQDRVVQQLVEWVAEWPGYAGPSGYLPPPPGYTGGPQA